MQDRAGEAGIGDLIYLDHNATTPVAAEVLEAMAGTLSGAAAAFQPRGAQVCSCFDVGEAQIRTIYTHFQPAQQCSEYIASLPGVSVEHCDSTAAACLKISELKDPSTAAIGHAAGQFGNLNDE